MTVAPLFFIHGWATDSRVWQQLCASPRTYYYDAPQFPDFNHLEQTFAQFHHTAQKPVTLIGWSLGGMLALQLARKLPAQIGKVILVGSTACFTSRDNYTAGLAPALVKRLARKLRQDCRSTRRDFYKLMFAPTEQRAAQAFTAVLAPLMDSIPEATLAGGLDYLLQTDLRPLLPDITTPCHIIHGTSDDICPVAAGEYLSVQLPHACLHTLATGHIPFYTRPTEFQNLLKECIRID